MHTPSTCNACRIHNTCNSLFVSIKLWLSKSISSIYKLCAVVVTNFFPLRFIMREDENNSKTTTTKHSTLQTISTKCAQPIYINVIKKNNFSFISYQCFAYNFSLLRLEKKLNQRHTRETPNFFFFFSTIYFKKRINYILVFI